MLPTTGTISVAGHDVTGNLAERTDARRALGYLPREVGMPSRMAAAGFLDYIAVLKEWKDTAARRAEVRRVLDLVHLGEQASKRISALSRQRRRLALAQAFMGDPRLIILDEPTTGLDPEQRASLRGLLSEQARRSAVLLATHQTEDVSALCDRPVRPRHRPRRRVRLLRRHGRRPRPPGRRSGLDRLCSRGFRAARHGVADPQLRSGPRSRHDRGQRADPDPGARRGDARPLPRRAALPG